jgi:hypothetical protein
LGVDAQASVTEIKRQYRILVFLHHPDKHNNTKESNQYFATINEAYHTLTNTAKRTAYDLKIIKNNHDFFHNYALEKDAKLFCDFLDNLTKTVNTVDSFDINKSELLNCLLFITQENKIHLIEEQNNQELCNRYFDNIEQLSIKLPYSYLKYLISNISWKNEKYKSNLLKLLKILKHKKELYYTGLLTPWVVLLISVLLCLLIYFVK